MNKQLFQMLLVMTLGLSASSALAMGSFELGPNDYPNTLRECLERKIAGATKSMKHANDMLQRTMAKASGDWTSTRGQVEIEIYEMEASLWVAKEQIERDCMQGIKDRLERLNFDPRRSDLEHNRARIGFNLAAAKDMKNATNKMNKIEESLGLLGDAIKTSNDVQSQWAVLLKVRARHPLKVDNNESDEVKDNQVPLPPIDPATPNNAGSKQDGIGKNSFFTNNRTYITGIAISAAVIGTAYFYGDHIKMWFTGKPVKPKQA